MQTVTLQNGLKIHLVEKPASETAAILLIAKTGSANEQPEEEGVAHFLEHMVFKGTKKRPNTQAISEYIDQIGGDYNAFTGKESTGFHCQIFKKHFDRGLDFVIDLVANPLLRTNDFDTEKGVILEEINLYEDTPMNRVDDLFTESLFSSTPLAHRISGEPKSIKNLTIDQLKNFYQRQYVAKNIFLVIAADQEILKKVNQLNFGKFPDKKEPDIPAVEVEKSFPKLNFLKKEIQQGNLIIGFSGPKYQDRDRYVVGVMTTLLGGMMSSRMFINIREKYGFCYYIQSQKQAFRKAGLLMTQAGIDPKNLRQTIEAILNEYRILKEKPVSDKELKKTQEYLKGKLMLSVEASDDLAEFYGSQLVYDDRVKTPIEVTKIIDSITKDDIIKAARRYLCRESLTTAIISPTVDEREVVQLLGGF
jgi:predicted Zn-dependent peptidase